MKISAAVRHMNTTSIVVIEMWLTRVTKLYSTTSNRNHTKVVPAKRAADTFTFFHSSTFATARSRFQVR